MPSYITTSELLPQDTREILEKNDLIMVTGQPVYHCTADGKEFFYDDCSAVVSLPVMVTQALITHIPSVGYNHLDPIYIDTYPALLAEDPETGDHYKFALIDDLHVAIEAPS